VTFSLPDFSCRNNIPIQNKSMGKFALLSVSDKTGLLPFAEALVKHFDYCLLSTGGTAKLLMDKGLKVTEVCDYTGFPELMDGRIKTLHPKIHGGLLCRRDKPEHLTQARDNNIDLIDLVVVNLYPFEETVAKSGVTHEEAIEKIDIGGPSMLRSAAKNHAAVTVVCDPNDYNRVLEGLNDEKALPDLRRKLALKVFKRTSKYDQAIEEYLESTAQEELPLNIHFDFQLSKKLRYGENPHQEAALYGRFFDCYEQLHGKELSYCNILDITAATHLMREFEKPTVAILKHTNPCGVASGENLIEAWEEAYATDKQAPFGGIIVTNRDLGNDLANKIREIFCEIVIAPNFTPEAEQLLKKKKNLRLMKLNDDQGVGESREIRSVLGGILAQEPDRKPINSKDFKVISDREPTEEEWCAMLFGWRVVKHIKSNAIVYARGERTLGIGAGQMSRVDSSKIAVWKASEAGLALDGSIMASDALIPFADGLIAAAESGATAVIQTGGSMRDEEVITAANKHNMAMVFTHTRHFRH
jgi:phosphoribosylaminoimidazolecarboxamide formyltransferase/IMP cyclohydrolase